MLRLSFATAILFTPVSEDASGLGIDQHRATNVHIEVQALPRTLPVMARELRHDRLPPERERDESARAGRLQQLDGGFHLCGLAGEAARIAAEMLRTDA